jgi:hypothetical protein
MHRPTLTAPFLVLTLFSARAAAQAPIAPGRAEPPENVETRPRRAPVISGLAMLGGAWAISTSAASVAIADDDDHFAPLYIPIAGPFVTIETAHLDWNGRRGWMGPPDRLPIILLLVDGVVQMAGAITLVVGMAAQEVVHVPAAPIHITPMMRPSNAGATSGLEVGGSF